MTQKMPFLPVPWQRDGERKECRMRLALYQPDIPQNAGAMMRLCACLGVALDIIEPCGFLLSDRNLRRAGMDYAQKAQIDRHDSWERFLAVRGGSALGPAPGRLVLLTTQAAEP